ncbi:MULTISPECIES: KGGVGR-motif variant AAA ATPase [unclassified Oceanobacter]|uniref:tyrosine-protein kinase family protein n=1 Tax=unclassified Oceanobacter TaxID=2620260 RepID=UPI0027346D0D|nr:MULTISPECIES: ArsA-related P-loop ATPase [unclassified Oceanobacter]MDP2609105.1 AAA family ATPase [Oceanobacter sp. 1_MG-2023]MDP2612427.1 AAA family ATPase [Oceanobacter sp. 2_MG-2023]
MITFDQINYILSDIFTRYQSLVTALGTVLINRDLNGRVRLILSATVEANTELTDQLQSLLEDVNEQLAPHAWPASRLVLFEDDLEAIKQGSPAFALPDYPNVFVVDRLATETDWQTIEAESATPRVVFFSIKGGVGRSSALAATAWSLAQSGKRVLVLDLDLESPGLSTAILPEEKQPKYGITDWLVEDLVDNGDNVMQDMIASSDLSHDGEILVVPAHGTNPGEYISKLGRVWMPKLQADGSRESWSQRLQRLILQLENKYQPDIVLIDSRAGIDEVASSCITDLGARLILLFAIDGSQTWSGYNILFKHWQRAGVIQKIRERLQIVSGLTPDTDTAHYLEQLRENAWNIFTDTQYDAITAGEIIGDRWNFEESDDTAPHSPWAVHWHRSFTGLQSLHGRLFEIDTKQVDMIFGQVINGIADLSEQDLRD